MEKEEFVEKFKKACEMHNGMYVNIHTKERSFKVDEVKSFFVKSYTPETKIRLYKNNKIVGILKLKDILEVD